MSEVAVGVRPRRRGIGKLGDRLRADGLLTDDALRQALEQQRLTGGFLGEILVDLGFLSATQIKPYLEETTGFPFIDVTEAEVDPDVLALFPEGLLTSTLSLPFRREGGKILVAMADPLNLATLDELRASVAEPLVPCLALPHDLRDIISRIFDVRHKTKGLLEDIPQYEEVRSDETILGLTSEAEEAPIVRLVAGIISGAVAADASDIHIEPQEGAVRVRYRIDGVLYEQMTFPTSHHAACVSRLKILATLDIGERRRPQDGRFTTHTDQGETFDIRMSVMPTIFGEKVCMRLLEKESSLASLDKLGLTPEQKVIFDKFIRKPNGLVLVTGPTGCGKTTTLYASVLAINDSTVNINTVEDPVEYKLHGVNQMQVNTKIGVTFANGLRTLVRQDPDIIFVGEIRDRETAEIAVQSALTGHLVLSSLHTNDAAGALVRLQHMGVESFLISSSMVGVVAQRLARTLCHHCKEAYRLTHDEAHLLGLAIDPDREPPLVARAKGCKRCAGRGTRGRTAVMEIMPISDALRKLILDEAPALDLQAQAIAEGFVTMRQTAQRKALEQVISVDEVIRILAEAE